MSASAVALRAPWGQEELLQRVAATVDAGRLPQSLLLHGPEGLEKRHLALWLAARLQCEAPAPGGPCGSCRSCRLSGGLQHPDIHLHFPMPRPKAASSRSKLREAIERQREERLGQLREDPDAGLDEGEVTGIYLAAIENLRAQASRRPAMGQRSVFVVLEADRMVPQSSSPEAANALLKLLEEPPDFAYLILTSSRPAALLPTIRSRTASLRVPPLPEDRVAAYLVATAGMSEERARNVARRAGGAVGRARRLSSSDEGEAKAAADRLLVAALSGSPGARLATAGEYSARGARAVLLPALEELRGRVRDMMCRAAGAGDRELDPEAVDVLIGNRSVPEVAWIRAFAAVEEAVEGTSRNLNPQSTVAVLLSDMDRALASGV